ncbi:transcriptional regulator, AraC family (plasmid) [Gloeocapsa sp. PCC 7428]|uniref:helix-turn-helix transcriptional regulator n=1 Tax=Gloeocapsa sp. PCC 7428 TaxID=1173026 RepID=UPI0002A5E38C|nr:AraC family transcriptional regulator [Gloeocapsa sp. PCC 7428]AFZ33341.1 transcriptional regulator, AraC family [Gloeocapsa sp. PCC 7428]
MTLILNQSDWEELCQQAPKLQPDNLVLDDFEDLTSCPELLGQEFRRLIELSPGVKLTLSNSKYCQDWMFKEPSHEHPIQFLICLSGFIHCNIHPSIGGTRGYFSGSGISPAYVEQNHAGEHLTLVDIELEPDVLKSFFLDDRQRHSDPIRQLFKGEDWKVSFYPTVTAKMRSLAQQLWNTPYRGGKRRLYLQSKVFELLVMQLDAIGVGQDKLRDSLKPTTLDRIYHAKDIMLADLENPPSVLELAQQVGVSVCTLQRRFQELFGMTVFGYLTDRRMELAEQLLRQGGCTVTEIAAIVGYSNPSYFAAAFKRKFGITPKECLLGKKIVLR